MVEFSEEIRVGYAEIRRIARGLKGEDYNSSPGCVGWCIDRQIGRCHFKGQMAPPSCGECKHPDYLAYLLLKESKKQMPDYTFNMTKLKKENPLVATFRLDGVHKMFPNLQKLSTMVVTGTEIIGSKGFYDGSVTLKSYPYIDKIKKIILPEVSGKK